MYKSFTSNPSDAVILYKSSRKDAFVVELLEKTCTSKPFSVELLYKTCAQKPSDTALSLINYAANENSGSIFKAKFGPNGRKNAILFGGQKSAKVRPMFANIDRTKKRP